MAYEKFFGLKETPFRLTPDPDYYFPSDVHKEALQTLLYSIRAGEGFVQITGHPGTGKTLILRTILRQLGDEVTTALILNPRLSPEDLLRVILEDLGLDPFQIEGKTREEHLRYFRDFLLGKAQEGQKIVVIIDEAQNLPSETMEELRLLSNLETEKEKLLQIILVGQVELEGTSPSEGRSETEVLVVVEVKHY
jgi:general secretion pathway protein A